MAELYAIGIVKLAGKERTKPLDQMSSPLDELVGSYEKQVIETPCTCLPDGSTMSRTTCRSRARSCTENEKTQS